MGAVGLGLFAMAYTFYGPTRFCVKVPLFSTTPAPPPLPSVCEQSSMAPGSMFAYKTLANSFENQLKGNFNT